MVFGGIKIKMTGSYHVTSTRMATVRKMSSNQSWQGCREIGTPTHTGRECKILQSLWKRVWQFLRELNMALSYDPVIPHLAMHPRELKKICPHGNLYVNALGGIIHNSKKWNWPECLSVNVWIKKKSAIHTTIQPEKGINCWHMLQLRWFLKALWQVKVARHKRPNIIWFDFYEMYRNRK